MIVIPSPELCQFLIERLPLIGEYEEYQILEFANALMDKGQKQKKISSNSISESMSYLYHAGIIGFTEKFTNHGMRLHYKRISSPERILKLLSSPQLIEAKKKPLAEIDLPELSPNMKLKKKKKKDAPVVGASGTASSGSGTKKSCCDHPRPVKNKKTQKRYCKNCGTTLKKKKKKDV